MNSMLFSVRVPVLSVNTYSTWKHNTGSFTSEILDLICWNLVFRVSYLSQLLVQVWRVDHRSLPQLLIKHLVVPHDEIGTQELLHLHGDVHGDGDNVVEENHESQEVCECPDHLRMRRMKSVRRWTGEKENWICVWPETHDVPLPLCVGPVVVPRLVSVGIGLPHVLQCGVDEGLADENAQVDHQVGIHWPVGGDSKLLRTYLFTVLFSSHRYSVFALQHTRIDTCIQAAAETRQLLAAKFFLAKGRQILFQCINQAHAVSKCKYNPPTYLYRPSGHKIQRMWWSQCEPRTHKDPLKKWRDEKWADGWRDE